MIKTPLSTVIGGAFWAPGATILGSSSKNLAQLIKSLFSLGEQGFAYDPNDLTTLYQDAAGTTPVTAAGQPVGLMLDKSKGLVLGGELAINNDFNSPAGWTNIGGGFSISSGKLYSTGSTNNNISRNDCSVVAGRFYKVVVNISSYTAGMPRISVGGNVIDLGSGVGTKTLYVQALSTTSMLYIYSGYTGGGGTWEMESVSIKELAGNHAYNTTSAQRPLLVANPQRLDFDTADDKLTTTLPAQLIGCTVIRSVPNVGTQILENQTIPTPYNDNIDNCGLIVINRALTANETSQITKLFNKSAGV